MLRKSSSKDGFEDDEMTAAAGWVREVPQLGGDLVVVGCSRTRTDKVSEEIGERLTMLAGMVDRFM